MTSFYILNNRLLFDFLIINYFKNFQVLIKIYKNLKLFFLILNFS